MLNPLTRGKGFKPVKMMRRLLGISSFMHAVDPVTSGGYPRELVLGSPERGLAHTIVHRAPRYGERQRNWELSSDLRPASTPPWTHHWTRKKGAEKTHQQVNSIPFLLRPHRTTALDPIQQLRQKRILKLTYTTLLLPVNRDFF